MPADVIADRLDEFLYVPEGAATQALLDWVPEPAFDQIEPGTRGGGKVQVKAWMTAQPTLDAWMFVGAVIVHDQVQVPILFQTGGTQGQEALPPQLHGRSRPAQLLGDLLVLDSLGGQQNNLRSLNEALRLGSGPGPGPQGDPLLVGKQNGGSTSAHVRQDKARLQISRAIYDALH
jgi:hypothetical protein